MACQVYVENKSNKGEASLTKLGDFPSRAACRDSRPPRQKGQGDYRRTILYTDDGRFINSSGW